MSYKNAFKCKNCPKSNDENGCPCWIELIWKNDSTGESEVEKGCYYQLTPKLLFETIRSAHISAENTSYSREVFEKGVQQLGDIVRKQNLIG